MIILKTEISKMKIIYIIELRGRELETSDNQAEAIKLLCYYRGLYGSQVRGYAYDLISQSEECELKTRF